MQTIRDRAAECALQTTGIISLTCRATAVDRQNKLLDIAFCLPVRPCDLSSHNALLLRQKK